jgi:putative ABC transport system permease protein
MDALLKDMGYGFRQLLRQRGSSLVAVVTLALGIGVSTAIFSVIDSTLLRPLPYPHPEQLVTVYPEETMPDGRVSRATASMEDMRTWQKSDDLFSLVAGVGSAFRGRVVEGAEPERVEVSHFTEDYLAMHGVTPAVGRDFTRQDADPGSPLVALLGYGYWQSRYGGREDIVGQVVRFDTEVATIVGVLPKWFNATIPVATPLRIPPDAYSRRGTGRVSVYARLRPGVTIEQAQERLSARMGHRTLSDGRTSQQRAVIRSRLGSALAQSRTTVTVLGGAVGLILLIACVNVAGLLLARGAARQSELAVRAAMGAGRARLIRQLLTESLVLALPGGALGVLLAWLTLDTIVANIPLSIPSNSPVTVNLEVLGLTAALLVPTVLLFGLAPAIRLSRVQVGSILTGSSRRLGSALSRRGGQILIAGEVALAVVLVAGAGLMVRSFIRISAVDLGFNARGLVVLEALPLARSPGAQKQFYDALLGQIRRIPGIRSAGIVNNFALRGPTTFTSVTAGTRSGGTTVFEVTPGYFETIGATLKAGRFPTDADYAAGLRYAVLNETAAWTFFEGSPIGRELTRAGKDKTPWTVIGVVGDILHGGPLSPVSAREGSQIFFPLEVSEFDLNNAMMLVMRPSGRLPGLYDRLRHVAAGIGPRVLVERITTSEELFGEAVVTPRRRTVLLGLLGGLGLTLALVGVFGMTAYAVTRRTAEIGVRMALGARPGQVVRSVVRDSALPIAIGTVLGIGIALFATRVIESFLFGTEPHDPATLAVVAVALPVAGCLAAFLPAMRAAEVDPASSLRAE